MDAPVGRNDKCPCGSGKKHKNCCMGKVSAKASAAGRVATGLQTWKLVLIGVGIIVVVGGVLFFTGFPRAAQIVGGVSLLVLIMYAAFRTPPPRRKEPGDAAGINFGR